MPSLSIDIDIDQYDEVIESRLTRKIDYRLVPLLSILCLFVRLNGTNIGNARLGGLERDLHLTSEQFQWGLSIFYLGFGIFQIPSIIMLRRWRPSKWISLVAFLWSIVAMGMATVKDFHSFLLCRFLLGSLQCSFFPGFAFYTSLWYQKKQQALRFGSIWSCSALAGALSGFISYGIGQIESRYFSQWQLIFLIQGFPTFLVAVYGWFYLPDTPEEASFLSDLERKLLIQRLTQDAGSAKNHSFTWAQVLSVFNDWKTYVYAILQFNGGIPSQAIIFFLPTLIHAMGHWTPVETQLMTIPPYLIAYFSALLVSRSSDQHIERTFHLLMTNLLSIIGLLILIFVDREHPDILYLGMILLTAGVYSNVSVRAAWINNNFASLTRRAIALAFISTFSASGGFISGHMYSEKQTPRYQLGHTIALCFVLAQAVLAIYLRFTLMFINHQRSQMNEQEIKQQIERYGGHELVGDRHPKFRYTL